jgi:replicative DNA helicase
MVKSGVEIVFIDQLSRIRGGSKAYEHNTLVVSELAALKKELRIPICLLAQINRRAEDRPDKRPNLMDLKSTGELEESADIVLIGHRPFMFTKKEEDRNRAEWELAKQRDGATTMLYMNWDAATTTFTELSTQKIVEATYERKDIDG